VTSKGYYAIHVKNKKYLGEDLETHATHRLRYTRKFISFLENLAGINTQKYYLESTVTIFLQDMREKYIACLILFLLMLQIMQINFLIINFNPIYSALG
jgi:hypothetical protein